MDVPLVVSMLPLAGAAWFWGPGWWRRWRHARVLRQPFPAAWRNILRRRMPAYTKLPPPLQAQLRRLIQIFVAEKPFIGCAGLVVTDEMRVLVAAQASLLQLNRAAGGYPKLREVLLYPGAFAVERPEHDGLGLVHSGLRRTLAGESWERGQVVLSWADVVAGAADPHDGANVAIHEFAHQLDQESGAANGAPFLGRRERYAAWAATWNAAYARLTSGAGSPIDAYGAQSPAEFFACASEAFFETPALLAAAEPALYQALAAYYAVDPLGW
jgi:MtfA peptidase